MQQIYRQSAAKNSIESILDDYSFRELKHLVCWGEIFWLLVVKKLRSVKFVAPRSMQGAFLNSAARGGFISFSACMFIDLLLGAAFTLPLIAIYLLPTFVACGRRVRQKIAIISMNFWFGWTIIGWFAALSLAMTLDTEHKNKPSGVRV